MPDPTEEQPVEERALTDAEKRLLTEAAADPSHHIGCRGPQKQVAERLRARGLLELGDNWGNAPATNYAITDGGLLLLARPPAVPEAPEEEQ